MSLFSEALKTYDTAEKAGRVGVLFDGCILAPIAHNTTNGNIEVTVTAGGDFVTARRMDKGEKILIPVTEDSAKRTAGIQHFSFCKRQWAMIHIEGCGRKICSQPKVMLCMRPSMIWNHHVLEMEFFIFTGYRFCLITSR